MPSSTSRPRGFTLLEVLAALAVLGVLLIAGLASTRVGMTARSEAVEYADLRLLAESKLSELAALSSRELRAAAGTASGRFPAPFVETTWVARIREEPGAADLLPEELRERVGVGAGGALSGVSLATSLFRVEVEVARGGDRLRLGTWVNRLGVR